MPHENRTISQPTGVVSAVFRKADDAEKAYRALIERGYTDDEINVLMSEQARDRYFPSERIEIERGKRKTVEGTGVGGAVGAAVGAIAGTIAAVSTVAIPGLGLVVAGPLAAALAGAGAGGITGGLIGALVGAGVHEDRAKVYKIAIEKGGVVLAVPPHTEEDAEAIAGEWEDCGGEEVYRG